MRQALISICLLFSSAVYAQSDSDTTLAHCPVFITDTVTANNFFIEARPVLMKVYRVKGKLTIRLEQKDQFFTLYFHEKKLRNTTYKIQAGSTGKSEVEAAYSFRTGDQSSYISVAKGSIDCYFDTEKQSWQLNISGLIINQVERAVTHYRVKGKLVVGS
ncbi:MAG TPA: hypothetical protein PLU11_04045 [Chitinophagaceae bacterium]|nr:hypothetical protein [Chitinophagaceae bacterium]